MGNATYVFCSEHGEALACGKWGEPEYGVRATDGGQIGERRSYMALVRRETSGYRDNDALGVAIGERMMAILAAFLRRHPACRVKVGSDYSAGPAFDEYLSGRSGGARSEQHPPVAWTEYELADDFHLDEMVSQKFHVGRLTSATVDLLQAMEQSPAAWLQARRRKKRRPDTDPRPTPR